MKKEWFNDERAPNSTSDHHIAASLEINRLHPMWIFLDVVPAIRMNDLLIY